MAGVIIGAVGSIVAGAVTRPISAGVAVLLYLDLRMRKEGLDLALQAAASRPVTGDEFETVWRPPPRPRAGRRQPPAAGRAPPDRTRGPRRRGDRRRAGRRWRRGRRPGPAAIGSQAAQQLARAELSKPDYHRRSR